MELIFWILVLMGWIVSVVYGLAFLDKKLDKWIDKRYKKEVK